jgi:hypothetical protein
MRFRSSILVSLTAVVIAVGWAATTADAQAPAPPKKPAAEPAATWYPSLDCTGRVEMRSCLVDLPHADRDTITTDDARVSALRRKVDDDLPLAGNDDIPITRMPVHHGGIWQ